jgi:hypothetical protein
VQIATVGEALNFLEAYQNAEEGTTPTVSFAGEMAELHINVDGARYNATIPAELARGLWEYQEAIYKAVAFALYGVEDIRKLTWEQKSQFELVFAVAEGSTDLMAPLKEFFGKLGEGFLTMESKHKAVVLVAIAVVLALGWGAHAVIESSTAAKKEEVLLQIEQERSKQQAQAGQQTTKQIEIMAGLVKEAAVVGNFAKANEEGTRAIARRAPDANQIKVGRARMSSDEIQEVNRRSQMERATAEIVEEDFRVFGTYARDASATKYTLARRDGSEFNVVVNHDDLPSGDLEKIWAAARDRKPIALQMNLTLLRGKVTSAQVVRVL